MGSVEGGGIQTGGGLPVLMRYRRILRTCAGSVITAITFILASPVYVNDVSGVAKTWIDRLAYVCHRPAFAGKSAYLIATVAASPTRHTLRSMEIPLYTWGFHIAGKAGYRMGALMPSEQIERRCGRKAGRAARALFEAVRKRRFLRPSLVSLMMLKIQQGSWQRGKDRSSRDYLYWRNQGWLNPGRTFFIAHRASPVKVALARLVGAVVLRLVTSGD